MDMETPRGISRWRWGLDSIARRLVSARASIRLASALALVTLAMQSASLFVLTLNTAWFDLSALGFNGVAGIVIGVTNPIVGWLIASRQPRNPIGWIFLALGLSLSGTGVFAQYAAYGLVTRPGSLPGADLASWVQAWMWVPGFTGLFLMLLLFPNGSLPSPRWRPILGLGIVSGGLTVIAQAAVSWAPRGLAIVESSPDSIASSIGLVLLSLVGLAAVASLVVRFRHADVVERQQIKWFAAAAAIEVAVVLLTTVITLPSLLGMLAALLVIPLVPIATVVAILRYRLYEIDRIISRTISWTLTTGAVVAVFAGIVIGLQGVLAQVTGGNTVAVAGSTLIVAALFQPLRRRVQRAVDRRFNRARYDSEQTLAAFGERVRAEIDLAALSDAVLATADEAVRPAAAGLWLRGAAE
jgi:hypothetical protein